MTTTIHIHCPDCQSAKVKKNGKKISKKQNYLCKDCGRQFIADHELTYKGCHSTINQRILKMLVRSVGIRDIADIENISINKVLSVLIKSNHKIKPKRNHYDKLEVDEFWIYVGKKKNKI